MSSSLQKAVEDTSPPEKLPSLQKAVEESKAPQAKPDGHDKDAPSLQKAAKKSKVPPAETNVDAGKNKDVPSLQKASKESKAPQSKTNASDGPGRDVPSLQKAVEKSKAPKVDASQKQNKDDVGKLDSSSRHKEPHPKPAAPMPADKLSASVNSSMQGSRYRPSGGNRRPLGTMVKEISQRFGSTRENTDDTSLGASETFPIQAAPKVRTTRKELETQNATQLARIQELEAEMQQQKQELEKLQPSDSDQNASKLEETVTKLNAQNAQLAAELEGSKEDVQRLQSSIDEENKNGSSLKATIGEQKKQIDALENKIAEHSKKLERANQQAANFEVIHKKQEQRIEELEPEAGPLRESTKAQDEQIKGLEEKLKRLQSMSEDASMKEDGLGKVIQEQETKLDALQKEKLKQAKTFSAEKEELNREVKVANREVAEWKATHKKQQQKLEDLESQAIPLREQAKDLEETVKRLEAQNQARLERIQSLEAENDQILQKLQEKEGEAERLQSNLDEQSLKGASLENAINEQKDQISSLQKEAKEQRVTYQAETSELKQKLERSKEKINRLQASVDDVSVKEHSLEKTIEEREAQMDSMREEMLAKAKVSEAEMGELKEKLQEMTADNKKRQRMVEDLQKESAEQANVANELKADNKTRLQRIRELEEQLQQCNQEIKLQQSGADRESQQGTSPESTLESGNEKLDEHSQRLHGTADVNPLECSLGEEAMNGTGLAKTIEQQKEEMDALLEEVLALGDEETNAVTEKAAASGYYVLEKEPLNDDLTSLAQELERSKHEYLEQQHGLLYRDGSDTDSLPGDVRRDGGSGKQQLGEYGDAPSRVESDVVVDASDLLDQGRKVEEMTASAVSHSEAVIDQFERAQQQENGTMRSRRFDRLKDRHSSSAGSSRAGYKTPPPAPYDEEIALSERDRSPVPTAPTLERCDTSELVKAHRHRRPTVLLEGKEVADMDLTSDGNSKAWGKPSHTSPSRKLPLKEYAAFGTNEMDASHYSASEAAAEQLELAWFQQHQAEEDKEIAPAGSHVAYSSARRSRQRGDSPPPPLTHYKEDHSGNMSPVAPNHPQHDHKHVRHSEVNTSHRWGRNVAVHSGDTEEEQGDIGLPKEVLKRLQAIHKGEDMDISFSNSEAIAEQLELAWVQQESEVLEPQGTQRQSSTRHPRKLAGSPPPLAPYGEAYSSNISPASPRHMRHQQNDARLSGLDRAGGRGRTMAGRLFEGVERQEYQGLPRDVMKRLNAVHKGDMDVSFSNSEAIAEQFQLTWMQQEQGGDTELLQEQAVQGPYSLTSRRYDGGESPGLTPYKEAYFSEVSPVTHRNPYQRQNQSAFDGTVGHRRVKSDDSSYFSEDTERELGDFGPFREKWSVEYEGGRMDGSPYRESRAAPEREAISNEMDASYSNSEAIAEQFEHAWFQQQDGDIEESPGKAMRSPYSSARPSRRRRPRRRGQDKGLNTEESARPEDMERALLRRCNTSELVREHRFRRPSVLLETNEAEADLDSSGSEANQKDWSKPSLCTVGNSEEYRRSTNRRGKHAAYNSEEMDGSFSNSEAIAEQLELAWFQQQGEEESEELMESPYSAPCRTRKAYEDESAEVLGDDYESRGLSNTVMGKLEAIYNDMDASFSDSEAIVEQMERVCFKKQQAEDETEVSHPRFDSKGMLVQNPTSRSHPWRKGFEGNDHNDPGLLHENVEGTKSSELHYESKGMQDTELPQVVQERQFEMIKTLQADNKELLRQLWDLEMNAEKDMEELQRELDARAARIAELELTCEELKEEKVILVQTSDMLRHLLREAEVTCAKQTASTSSPEEKKQD